MKSIKLSFNHFFILISVVFFIYRIDSLGFDQTNNDSVRWFNRSEGFLQALKTQKFNDTYQYYHPGVTLMIINSFARQIFYTFQYNYLSYKIDLMSFWAFPFLNLFSKLSNIVVIYICIIVQIFLIKKLWRTKTALVYFLLISLEPYVIGLNRWFHLTSLECTFGFTSILLLLYWNKFDKFKYFVSSAVFLGLAVLTKTTSLILLPVIFYVLYLKFRQKEDIYIFFKYVMFTAVTVFALFPALWVSPLSTGTKVFSYIFNAVGDDLRKYQLSYYLRIFYYFVILAFRLSPLTIILFIITIYNFKKLRSFENNIIYLTFLSYFILLSLSDKKIDRYSLVFFSPIILLSSHFISKLENKLIYVYCSSALIFSFYVFIYFSPNYSSYYNPFLNGTKGALQIGIYENGGDFFYDAAKYLNTIGTKDDVYVPDNYEAFSMFYRGKSLRDLSDNPKYVVTSLDIDRTTYNNHGCEKLVKEFGPADYKVVAIFECK